VEENVPAPVLSPPTPLAPSLATQLVSPGPAQKLLSYLRDASNVQLALLHGLEEHRNLTDTPHPDDCISLAGGLEHIQFITLRVTSCLI